MSFSEIGVPELDLVQVMLSQIHKGTNVRFLFFVRAPAKFKLQINSPHYQYPVTVQVLQKLKQSRLNLRHFNRPVVFNLEAAKVANVR